MVNPYQRWATQRYTRTFYFNNEKYIQRAGDNTALADMHATCWLAVRAGVWRGVDAVMFRCDRVPAAPVPVERSISFVSSCGLNWMNRRMPHSNGWTVWRVFQRVKRHVARTHGWTWTFGTDDFWNVRAYRRPQGKDHHRLAALCLPCGHYSTSMFSELAWHACGLS